MRLAPGQAVGRYDVVDLLGEGGMSESYRARDRETGETVVLKIPFANMIGDPSTYSRYERETEIGRRLVHPNIQRLLDTGRLDDSVAPYIVWEYVDGQPLRQYLSDNGPLPIDESVALAHQLASAIDACHQAGIVHRDLKPENVLITPEHQLKLLDFGIALLQGARRLTWSRLSNTVGTPDYMAPEQIKGERGDRRTDIYALGMMLFEMLAGKMPYEGDNALSIMNQHVNQEAPRVKSKRMDVPQQVDAIVAKAIRRNPNERYQSVTELLQDLDHWQEIDTTAYIWVEQTPVGPMPGPLKTAALIVAVFAALALIGLLAQVAHGPH